MTTKEVAEKTGNSIYTLNKWAKDNGVKKELVEGTSVFGFVWTERDLDRFNARNKQRGYPSGKPRKPRTEIENVDE